MYQNFLNTPYTGVNPYQSGNPYLDRLNQLQAAQMPQPTQQGLIRVTGMEGAKAYQMGPNSAVPLFDANEDVFFVKSTDGAGFPTIRAFRFTPIESVAAPAAATGDFITREEFNQFKEAFLNGKQSVPNQSANAGPANGE